MTTPPAKRDDERGAPDRPCAYCAQCEAVCEFIPGSEE